MIFKLPNEHSFILNHQFFFLLFLAIKILSNEAILCAKTEVLSLNLKYKKKYKSWDKSFILFLKIID